MWQTNQNKLSCFIDTENFVAQKSLSNHIFCVCFMCMLMIALFGKYQYMSINKWFFKLQVEMFHGPPLPLSYLTILSTFY
jgi:hypothetical protein